MVNRISFAHFVDEKESVAATHLQTFPEVMFHLSKGHKRPGLSLLFGKPGIYFKALVEFTPAGKW